MSVEFEQTAIRVPLLIHVAQNEMLGQREARTLKLQKLDSVFVFVCVVVWSEWKDDVAEENLCFILHSSVLKMRTLKKLIWQNVMLQIFLCKYTESEINGCIDRESKAGEALLIYVPLLFSQTGNG